MGVRFSYPFLLGIEKEQEVPKVLLDSYRSSYESFLASLRSNEYPQLDMPEKMLQDTLAIQEALKGLAGETEEVVVVGIGGSSLGLAAIHSFLFGHLPYGHGGLVPAIKKRVRIVEMPTEEDISGILQGANPKRTRFVVISKSGTTLETLLGLLSFLEPLRQAHGDAYIKDHFLFVTDPESSALLSFAKGIGARTFVIPNEIGGRFSILGSHMAVVFLGLLGLDAAPLFEGAINARKAVLSLSAEFQVPFLLGSGVYQGLSRLSKSIWVMFAYGDALEGPMLWLRQLVSESLGKEGLGVTPLAVKGPSDQHSILQLLDDGPDDKIFTFFSLLPRSPRGEALQWVPEEFRSFSFLKGKRLQEAWEALWQSSYLSLASKGKPASWMGLEESTLEDLGVFFWTMEATVIYMGTLLGVNPFDQPAVERSKKLCRALLGGAGLEAEQARIEELLGKHKTKSIEV
jgi:glucose-6-phosphate isomerase